MSRCTTLNQSLEDQRLQEWADRHARRNQIEGMLGEQKASKTARLTKWLSEKQQDVLTEKELNSAIRAYVKPQDREQAKLSLEIISRMEANPLIEDQMYFSILENSRYLSENDIDQVEYTENKNGDRVPVLDTLPVTILRNIQGDLNGALNGGKMFQNRRGILGNMQYEWGSPRRTMMKDPSGTMFKVNEVTEQFTYNAQSFANQYLYAPRSRTGAKVRDYGFTTIAGDVDFFADYTMDIPAEDTWKLFSEIMEGRTIYDQRTGFIMRHQEEVKMPNGQFEWRNLKPFTYKENGQEKILKGFTPAQLETFQQIELEAREMFKLIGKDMENEISYISQSEGALKRRAKEAGLEDWLESMIGGMVDDELLIAGLNAGEMKSGKYYPRMFLRGKITLNLQEALISQEDALKKKKQTLNNPDSGMDTPTKKQLADEIFDHEFSILAIQRQLNMAFDQNQSYSPNTGDYNRTQSWYKNFKNVTRVMNPNDMRYDENVMEDYVNNVSNAVIRNDAIIKVGNALLDAKINGFNDNVIGASKDIFDATFFPQNAASQMFGKDLRASTISKEVGQLGIPLSEERIINGSNSLSNMTTANVLFGIFQGVVNYSALLLKLDRVGLSDFVKASHEMTDPKRRDVWRDIIAKSGINTFSEFVTTYFSHSMRPDEVAAYKTEIKQFEAMVQKAEKTGNIAEIKKYRNYIKKQKKKIAPFKRAVEQAANYVITRNLYYKKNAPVLGKVLETGSLYAKVMPSINDTEQMLRSTSFIIGAMNEVKTGRAKDINSKEAIDAGIQMAMNLDFGLSHQHVGAALRGPIAGQQLNKMKIWHVQKAGFDIRTFTKAVRSMTPDLELSNGKFNTKAMNAFRLGTSGIKLLATNPLTKGVAAGLIAGGLGASMPLAYLATAGVTLGSNKSKKMRKVNNYVAHFNSAFIRQAMVTGLMDLVIFGAPATLLANSWLKRNFFASGMSKGIQGMGSSAISLGIALTQIAAGLLKGEDEKEIEKLIPRALFHTPIGIGAGALYAAGKWAQDVYRHDRKYELENLDHWEDNRKRALSPYIPFGKFGYGVAAEPVIRRLSGT